MVDENGGISYQIQLDDDQNIREAAREDGPRSSRGRITDQPDLLSEREGNKRRTFVADGKCKKNGQIVQTGGER